MALLDPKHDVVFKLLFGRVGNEDLLRSMIEAVVSLEAPIASLEVLNPGLGGDGVSHKSIALDLRVQLANGTLVDVEVETYPRPVAADRFLYYWARLHGSQLEPGMDYRYLTRTIGIIWLNGALPMTGERFHSRFHVTEDETRARLSEHLELHLLALPQLSNGDVSDELRRWATFLLAKDEGSMQALRVEGETMTKAVDELERLSSDPANRHLVEGLRRQEYFRQHELWVAKEEGREAGREASSLELVRAMLSRGATVEEILRLTGLPEELVRRATGPAPTPVR